MVHVIAHRAVVVVEGAGDGRLGGGTRDARGGDGRGRWRADHRARAYHRQHLLLVDGYPQSHSNQALTDRPSQDATDARLCVPHYRH